MPVPDQLPRRAPVRLVRLRLQVPGPARPDAVAVVPELLPRQGMRSIRSRAAPHQPWTRHTGGCMTGRNGRYSQSLGSPRASKLPCFALIRNDRHAVAGYPNEAALGFCESRTKMLTLADATSTQAPFPILRRAFRQLSRLSPAASLDTINPQPYIGQNFNCRQHAIVFCKNAAVR
jgi:hypothetical protein